MEDGDAEGLANPEEHLSGRSLRMLPSQTDALTQYCYSSELNNAHAYLQLLLAAQGRKRGTTCCEPKLQQWPR